MKIDATDKLIISILLQNGRLSSADLAEKVSLSPSPCWRRVKRLEDMKIITGYHAHVNLKLLGLSVHSYIYVSLSSLNASYLNDFEKAVLEDEKILSCYRVSGRYDYKLETISEGMEEFGDYAKNNINNLPGVKEVYTTFVLGEVKRI